MTLYLLQKTLRTLYLEFYTSVFLSHHVDPNLNNSNIIPFFLYSSLCVCTCKLWSGVSSYLINKLYICDPRDRNESHVGNFRIWVFYIFLKTTFFALKWHQKFGSTLLFDKVTNDYVFFGGEILSFILIYNHKKEKYSLFKLLKIHIKTMNFIKCVKSKMLKKIFVTNFQ